MRLLVKNIGTIVGIETAGRLRLCGGEMDRLETFDDAWLLADNGRIAAFGSMNSLGEMAADEVVDAGGGMLFPSFCDSHTHLVYAGSREQEFLDKINGLTYEQIARRGDVANRSEAVRDLIRASIAKEQMRTPDEHVIGSLTMIYDHHTGDLTRRLDEVQHDYTDEIVSTMHVHLDHHNCLEILALKGRGERVYELADRLLGLRGVKHGELTCAATKQSLGL